MQSMLIRCWVPLWVPVRLTLVGGQVIRQVLLVHCSPAARAEAQSSQAARPPLLEV
jgi:hypothetical protein